MRWTHLGHAMWMCEVAEQRLLFDPLLGDTHHCGVYQTTPHRTLHVDRLRPTAVLVSHRHPDHFDIGSLHRLAQYYPHVPLFTPDPLVISSARRLGFRDVRSFVTPEVVELPGVRLTATLSLANDEWGMVVASEDGAVWNQVDTVLRSPDHVRAVAAHAAERVGCKGIDLALVRWQPMHEVAAQLGGRIDFPLETYADLLAQIVATGASAIVPSACGAKHSAPYAWLDNIVYPVSPQRFLRDMANFEADLDAFPALLGARYDLRGGEVNFDPKPGGEPLVHEVLDTHDPRDYRPLSVPALTDANPGRHRETTTRPDIARWVLAEVAPALAREFPGFGVEDPLRFVVEVQFADEMDAFTITVDGDGARVETTSDPAWDAIMALAGSLLWEVIQGRRGWGDILLAGGMRAHARAYSPFNGRVRKLPVAPTFLYYALSYDRSVERAVAWELDQVCSEAPSS
ncbi:MAG: MBL fold metallo-hydrolase [Nannocystales bacterium]